MKRVITGDHAVALGAKLCRVEVVPAYPITPQTLIIEHIAEFVNDGELDAKFMKMPRQALHAHQLEITHPISGEPKKLFHPCLKTWIFT